MQTSFNEPRQVALPFVARKTEALQLQRLHAQRKHALILGPAGVGKTALVDQLGQKLDLLVCPHSERFSSICENLEEQLGLPGGNLKLLPRKRRLHGALAGAGRTVVFDGVGWTTPRLSSFLESVMERVAIWICARSERCRDIGHFWPLLVRFETIQLHPFRPAETRAAVDAAVETGLIPRQTLNFAGWLHRRSKGNPLLLRELIQELAARRYDPASSHALRRLDLDRRIREVFPSLP